jgi:LmbE family N-acetylglucosaminyl deacetylase
MKKSFTFFLLLISFSILKAQPPAKLNSADILLRLKKLNVLGNVLYVAAHPDDENTRLLAYLANEKLYRAGYLSLTRGDGGQNLIGDEQGAELGLIRTQELLAARRIDGAEQFFSRAYDFGFSKHTEEALERWDKNLILSDVVWVIRKFQPDVIITRFPEDSRAGHGHHSASAVLAHEAFIAAADSTKFPEQFKEGVRPWQAKRILWNTFNFGSVNTQNDNQFKIDVGGYNALLGKGYGEIAAESRSQHKSQGFGVPAQRGIAMEYFLPVAGDPPTSNLLDGVDTTWSRAGNAALIKPITESIIRNFSYEHPEQSVAALVKLYALLKNSAIDAYWKNEKLREIRDLVEACSGIYFEATTNVPYVAAGDSLRININVINRSGLNMKAVVLRPFDNVLPSPIPFNQVLSYSKNIFVPVNMPYSQPYWLEKGLTEGHFIVDKQSMIGLPENPPAYDVAVSVEINNESFVFSQPVRYKYTDPVNGEIYQPLSVVPALSVSESPAFVFTRLNKKPPASVKLTVTALTSLQKATASYYQYSHNANNLIKNEVANDSSLWLHKNEVKDYALSTSDFLKKTKEKELRFYGELKAPYKEVYQSYTIRKIEYPHIPSITYFYLNKIKVIDEEIITSGKRVGYITGAGDKVPDALTQLGYEVVLLGEKDIYPANLTQFDAVVAGVRAYNVHDWLNDKYTILMDYIKGGGNYIVQYNTNNYISSVKEKIGPYPFTVSRERVTDENAVVKFLHPNDALLNWPNKITSKDFEGWIQERGTYFATDISKEYRSILTMRDPGEKEQEGSLIVADYGKGRFIYTGLVFFRQLPAGIGGAYRLFANLVSNPNYQTTNGTTKRK